MRDAEMVTSAFVESLARPVPVTLLVVKLRLEVNGLVELLDRLYALSGCAE